VTKCENELVTTLNLACLLPHLKKRKLLTDNDADLLSKPEPTRQDTVKFLSILKTKGRLAFSLFTDALHDETEHLGHSELYKILTSGHDHGYNTQESCNYSCDYMQETATQQLSSETEYESESRLVLAAGSAHSLYSHWSKSL